MFDHEVHAVIYAMRDLTVWVFEHLDIKYVMDIYLRIKYTECILRVPELNKYLQVLAEFK